MSAPPVKSAERTLDVLEFIAWHSGTVSHTEIAVGLGIPAGSLSKLLLGLRNRDYLQVDAQSGHYRLGPALFSLVARGRMTQSAEELALPVLQWLTSVTGEASSYNAWSGDRMERVSGVDSMQPLGYRMGTPRSFPLYSSSGGKAVLAALPQKELDSYISAMDFEPGTTATVRNAGELRAQIDQFRKEGIATSRNEHTMGVTAMGVAVLAGDHQPIGALTIVVPDVRFNDALASVCKKSLLTAAARLQQALRMAQRGDKTPPAS